MSIEKEIIYTQAARIRLEQLRKDIEKDILAALREQKSIPGDVQIEITGSDVEELARSMSLRFFHKNQVNVELRMLVVRAYMVIGALTVLIGFFYDSFRNIFHNPIQAMLIGAGLLMMLASYALWLILRRRDLERARFNKFMDQSNIS